MATDNKALLKILTKIVDKFTAVSVAYTNGLATEDKLKQNACTHIGVLTRLKAVDNLQVDGVIAGFLEVIKADRENLEAPVNKVCKDLYDMIHKVDAES